MSKEQTAVEWLIEHLTEYGFDLSCHQLEISQAKELEKQQIIEAHAVGRIKEVSGILTDGEQYYNEKYN